MRRVLIFSTILAGLFLTQIALANNAGGVTLLEPSVVNQQSGYKAPSINEYLQGAFTPFLGLIAALSVVMIIWGGLEYMFSEVVSNKAEAKKRIWAAVLGLILALGAYLLLKTINPQLVETKFEVQQPSGGDGTFPGGGGGTSGDGGGALFDW